MVTRVGNTVYPQYLEVRGVFNNGDSAGAVQHVVRVIAFICKSPNNTEVTVADLIDNDNDKDQVVYGMRNLNHRNNFRVLMDKEVVLAP